MKRIFLIVVCLLIAGSGFAQEWFTSFDVAKRLARVQNKMLFVVWEASLDGSVPVVINGEDGKVSVVDLAKETGLDATIWNYFVPVKLSEFEYEQFIKVAANRSYQYIDKLNDDSIKIMDANGNILNVDGVYDSEFNDFSAFIGEYALNTLYLRSELDNYAREQNFLTASLLAIRYVDFSIYASEKLKPELIELANIYLDESVALLSQVDADKKEAYQQKIELIRIKEDLILGQAKKVRRQLKRLEGKEINQINESLIAFLNYTVFKMLDDEISAELWKSKISSLDLSKAELILKNK